MKYGKIYTYENRNEAKIGIGDSEDEKKITEAWNHRHNPWHTGTPTEAGEYLCWVAFPEQICVDTESSWKCKWEDGKWYDNQYEGKLLMVEDLGAKIVAWQKIEPYKEKKDGGHTYQGKWKEMSSKNLKYAESEYIDYDIPNGDMDADIRMYHSKAVKVRKDCRCTYCGYPIRRGEYALAFSVLLEGEFCYGHYCMGCVEDNMSMGKGEIDDTELLCRYVERLEAGTGPITGFIGDGTEANNER